MKLSQYIADNLLAFPNLFASVLDSLPGGFGELWRWKCLSQSHEVEIIVLSSGLLSLNTSMLASQGPLVALSSTPVMNRRGHCLTAMAGRGHGCWRIYVQGRALPSQAGDIQEVSPVANSRDWRKAFTSNIANIEGSARPRYPNVGGSGCLYLPLSAGHQRRSDMMIVHDVRDFSDER